MGDLPDRLVRLKPVIAVVVVQVQKIIDADDEPAFSSRGGCPPDVRMLRKVLFRKKIALPVIKIGIRHNLIGISFRKYQFIGI